MIKNAMLFILFSWLIGCASMSKDECLNANWYMIGLEDGARGMSSLTLSKHRKACAKVDVTPDLNQYQAGHREGLNRYCVYHNGVALGQRGAAVNRECPLSAQPFYDGYAVGRKIYTASVKVKELNKKIEDAQAHIESINNEIAETEQILVDGQGDRLARREALESLDDLRDELAIHQEELSHLEFAYHRAEHYYQALLREK